MPSSRPTGKHIEGELQLILSVRRGHDGADAPYPGRRSEGNTLCENALREQPVRQFHGEGAVADDDRRDRISAQY